ncbi:MAG: S41 family peptidase, partial [bacterium]|nr:S41 family peptidase [bacterium]
TKQYLSLALIVVFIACAVVFGGWIARETHAAKPDYYFEIEKNIDLFGKIYEEIATRYVEEIDPEKFMKSGIEGMLRTLDPYTVFIEQEGTSELQIITTGKYGGVGMRISKREGWPTVAEPPFEGTPSAKAGIREGDQIIEVDGIATNNLTITETAQRLRGEMGTEVNVKIQRVGEPNPLEFRLIRAEISVSDVTFSGFITDKIGYIRLSHFSRYAGKQVSDSIAVLKKQGMESLILDLRGNPGGLLESAVQVAENFIPKDDLIVYTRGRSAGTNVEYRSRREPIWGDKPLVVLVDNYSASASEIVAGAIQDQDRGLIVGSRTFGKGLVQTVVPLSGEGTALKITTHKYFIPSGRLIQTPDFIRSKDILWGYDATKDTSLEDKKVYLTSGKRKVHGNGGIVPDIKVDSDEITPLVGNLIMKSMFFNYALEYASSHKNLAQNFVVDDGMIAEFKKFIKTKNFTYRTEAEDKTNDLEKVLKEEKYPETVLNSLANLKESLAKVKEQDFDRDIEMIKWNLKTEIAAKLWGTPGKYHSEFQWHSEIKKAVEILASTDNYDTLLSSNVDIH